MLCGCRVHAVAARGMWMWCACCVHVACMLRACCVHVVGAHGVPKARGSVWCRGCPWHAVACACVQRGTRWRGGQGGSARNRGCVSWLLGRTTTTQKRVLAGNRHQKSKQQKRRWQRIPWRQRAAFRASYSTCECTTRQVDSSACVVLGSICSRTG